MIDPKPPTEDEALRLAAPAPSADEPDEEDSEEAADLAAAGLAPLARWTDDGDRFALTLARRAG